MHAYLTLGTSPSTMAEYILYPQSQRPGLPDLRPLHFDRLMQERHIYGVKKDARF